MPPEPPRRINREPAATRPVVLISALASNATGSGHVARMASLAEELLRRGGARVVVRTNEMGAAILQRRLPDVPQSVPQDAPPWLTLGPAPDAPGAAMADLVGVVRALRPDVAVLDGYHWSAPLEAPLRPHCGRLVVVDDLADRPHLADLLVDPNPNRHAGDYAGLVPPGCRLAVGAGFTLLSGAFRAARAGGLPHPDIRAGRDLVFVSLGGGDPGRDMLRLVRALLSDPAFRVTVATGGHIPDAPALRDMAARHPDRLDLALDSDRVPAQMLAAGLAVTSGGTLTWERAALGLPGLGLILADNQEPAARWLQARGLQPCFDLRGGWDAGAFLAALQALARDPGLRRTQAEGLARLIDGTGVAAVADLLLEPKS
jgi:UDP-2,4-diacetamido-2,4,6-trideoxy-beta-L-altropyranose hydrolase